MAGNYLIPSRHGTLLYFRRRVPDDLRAIVGKPYLVKSLNTGRRREAIILARALAARTDDLFHRLRTMPHDHDEDGITIDFGFKLDLNEFGKPSSITISDAKPEDQDAVNSIIETTLRNLPAPGVEQVIPLPTKNEGKTISAAWEAFKAQKIAANAWRTARIPPSTTTCRTSGPSSKWSATNPSPTLPLTT